MFKKEFYFLVYSAIICALLRLGFIEISARNERFCDKYPKLFKLFGILAWVFIILATIILITANMKGEYI